MRRVGEMRTLRLMCTLQAGSKEVKDDAWARDGWDGDIQAAKAAKGEGKAQADYTLDVEKDASEEGELDEGDMESRDLTTALNGGVADIDQKNVDDALAKTGPAKGALQKAAMPAGGRLRRKKQPSSKAGRPGVKAGSMAANAGSSASSARVTAEAKQPGKRGGQDGQGVGTVKGTSAVPESGAQKVGSVLGSHKADVPWAQTSLSCHAIALAFGVSRMRGDRYVSSELKSTNKVLSYCCWCRSLARRLLRSKEKMVAPCSAPTAGACAQRRPLKRRSPPRASPAAASLAQQLLSSCRRRS